MDTGKRSALTALGLVAMVLLGVGSMRRRGSYVSDAGSTITTTVGPSTTTDASTKADPADLPDPVTDYKALDDAKLDGSKAIGKTILLHVWRGATEASTVTLYACGKGVGGYLTATYSVEKRPLVRSITTSIPFEGHCPRAVIKLTGKEQYTNDFKGEVQQILDVVPYEAEALPAGVDYVSMDDVNIDGKKAAGKIALLKAYRGDTQEKKFTAYPCGKAGGLNFLYVNFASEQKEAVRDLSSSPMACQALKVKLVSQQPYSSSWNAQLLEVSKD